MYNSKFRIATIILAFCVLPVFPANAQSSEKTAKALRLDQMVSGALQPGETAAFEVPLIAGDYMQAMVDQVDGWVDIDVFDPTGQKVKSLSDNPVDPATGKPRLIEPSELEELNLIGLRDGAYRIELRPVNKSKATKFTISYSEHKNLAQRMELPPIYHPYQSPQILALRKELQQGHREALASFWSKVKTQGEPLIEPMQDDPNHRLVTILWQDTYGVKNVALAWESYTSMSPAQYTFTRLLDTDLWYLTLRLPSNARFVYQLSPDDDLIPYDRFDPFDNNARERHEAGLMPDPLNPHHWVQHNGDFSLAELPDAPAQPWVAERPNVPKGAIQKDRFKSTILKNDREIAIYTPPGYSKSHAPYWLMVLFDEKQYMTMVPTPTIVDNLIAAKKIPPMVVVLVDAIDRDARRSETMGPQVNEYTDAIATELMPLIRKNYNVSIDPARTIIAGSSANGFTAVHVAWLYPNIFGNVLCQSGALSWSPGFDIASGARVIENPEWLTHQLAANPAKPIRFFLEAGLFEDSRLGILDSSHNFADVARAKGYQIKYQDFAGGHNYINWRGSIADGLIYLTNSSGGTSQK